MHWPSPNFNRTGSPATNKHWYPQGYPSLVVYTKDIEDTEDIEDTKDIEDIKDIEVTKDILDILL